MNNEIPNFIENSNILYTKLYNNNNDYKFTEIPNNILDTINEFILVVDLAYQTGGCRFFLDTIISHYKKNTLFVIVKNFKNNLHLIINNEYLLEEKYTLDKSILFIEKYKYKINRIFFNHILDHNKNFIEKLFTINKHTTLITHDYFFVSGKPQIYFYELPKKTTFYIDINNFDEVITQNEVNVEIFKNYYNKKINVIELPDFKNSNNKIQTNNENIVVGIIGLISIEKGRDILEKIINFYKDTNITIVVFGFVDIIGFNNFYTYNNINELNNLLIKHKPNILLELSLWPETYSYTLSLSMLTKLPILCLKKKFPSVVQNRLSNYNSVYYFSNYNNLSNLIHKYKQDFFYTIEETVYFDKMWNNYFFFKKNINNKSYFHNIDNKNIVFITSKIIVSDNSFSYVKKRSCYSKQERILQTINTINSIRNYIPDPHIILIDNSIFNYFDYNILDNLVDTFINITTDANLNYFTDIFQYKAFGEISQQLAFFNLFLKQNYSGIKNFFKITGRYSLNDNFCYEKYNNDLNIFKKHLTIKEKEYYYTCFYKLDKNILEEVHNVLKLLVENKEKYMNNYSDFEVIFPNAIIDKITLTDVLGVVENIGVWKKITDI